MRIFKKVLTALAVGTVVLAASSVREVYADDFVIPVETLNAAGIDSKISECTTKYTVGQDRSKNIETAASYINGLVLVPGQLFSYDYCIHPRTIENGYGPGNAIINGGYKKVIGGGICQVSSTLNNAVLQAGIIPTERHNHSTGVHYLPSGLDATVSAGTLDYQFVNTLAYPIYIQAIARDGLLTVAFYSNHDATSGIMYKTEVQGSAKKNTTYLVGYFNGVEISRFRAYSSSYK